MRCFRMILLILICIFSGTTMAADTLFIQPFSEKSLPDADLAGAILKKVVVDHNDVVYVLTDQGVARLFENRIIRDLRYRPFQHRVPIDISVQPGTGFLFYLFDDALLSNEEAGKLYYRLPLGKYTSFEVSEAGAILLMGADDLALFEGGNWKNITRPAQAVLHLYVNDGRFYILTANSIYLVQNGQLEKLHSGMNLQALAFGKDDIIVGTSHGYYGINKTTGGESILLQTKIPILDVRFLTYVNNQLWAGTANGAFMKRDTAGYDYYASKRWLLADSITGMAKGNHGDIYFLNSSGVNRISFVPYSYGGKARYFQQKIRQRHIRYGLLSQVRLNTPGALATAEMVDTDNDGLWSSFYLGSQAFRYTVTGDEIAREHVWETFEAYERLVSINPLEGFPSRTFERKGFKVSDPHAWRVGKDSAWEWKGTTSSDEFVGYIFITAMMDQFVAKSAKEKRRVAQFIDTILMHIIRNNYNFVDADGKPTRWGRWNPDYINSYAKTISDRKLGSLDIIAGLQLGYALTGKSIYKEEALRLMKDHGYLDNIMINPFDIKATPGYFYDGTDMGTGPWNHSDDEMEFLSFWVLHHYAFDKELQKKYDSAIRQFWQIELPERHPVWNLITLGTEGSFDRESTLWYLREFPVDQIRWDVKNSIRKDLDFLPPNFRQQFTKDLLSPRERPAHRYNANEFILDGGSGGREELTGAEYLLPYWMARYLGALPM